MNQNGFTGKEFLFTILTMGLLCILAIWPYRHWRGQRQKMLVVSAVQGLESKLKLRRSETRELTRVLDNSPVGQICRDCFSRLSHTGVQQAHWFKKSDNLYLFSTSASGEHESDFAKPGDFTVEYKPVEGRFVVNPVANPY